MEKTTRQILENARLTYDEISDLKKNYEQEIAPIVELLGPYLAYKDISEPHDVSVYEEEVSFSISFYHEFNHTEKRYTVTWEYFDNPEAFILKEKKIAAEKLKKFEAQKKIRQLEILKSKHEQLLKELELTKFKLSEIKGEYK